MNQPVSQSVNQSVKRNKTENNASNKKQCQWKRELPVVRNYDKLVVNTKRDKIQWNSQQHC